MICGLSNLVVGQQLCLRIASLCKMTSPWGFMFFFLDMINIRVLFTLRVILLESNHSATLANSELQNYLQYFSYSSLVKNYLQYFTYSSLVKNYLQYFSYSSLVKNYLQYFSYSSLVKNYLQYFSYSSLVKNYLYSGLQLLYLYAVSLRGQQESVFTIFKFISKISYPNN